MKEDKLRHLIACMENMQWLTHCATNRKVAGAIPDSVFEVIY